jgi:hypothetical protein
MFGGIRLLFIGIIASAVIGASVYVMKLRSDNAILKQIKYNWNKQFQLKNNS